MAGRSTLPLPLSVSCSFPSSLRPVLREARGPSRPRSGRPPSGCWPGSGTKDGPEAGGKVVGVRWEQADATAAVAGSIGGSARGKLSQP